NARAMVGYHAQEAYQAARTGAGRAPGRVVEAKSAYSAAAAPVTASSPMAAKIQPTALPGRWATTRAPTPVNAVKARSSAIVSVSDSSCWKLLLAPASRRPAATQAANAASRDPATQVQRRLIRCLLADAAAAPR